MIHLSETRRIELALPARMLASLSMGNSFSCLNRIGGVTNKHDFAKLVEVRLWLHIAFWEPFSDYDEMECYRVRRRLAKLQDLVLAELHDQPGLKALYAILYWLQSITSGENPVLVLVAGSYADKAVTRLLAWGEAQGEITKGIEKIDRSAQKQAAKIGALLNHMGFYLGGSNG
ncbi:hypothetical protein [Pleomorphomonas sp. PLEO]|uniref:hypothetical protein n=1 Tax=Pleomorphomonas sp. PLEO TaxID=3239306 RepID=UPI00351E06E1